MFEIVFLGTGGGRFATITQKRRTGGLRILGDKTNIHVDPGPGALVYSLAMGLNPQKIGAILVSHSHEDHTNDAEVLIEAMSHGTVKKRGILAAAPSVLHGSAVCEQSISKYHQMLPEKVLDAKVAVAFKVGAVNIKVCKAMHTDPDTVGFRFETPDLGDFAYLPDSEYFETIGDSYSGVRLLVLSVLRPSGEPWKGHMTTDDAIKVLDEVRPEMAVLTHFGMQMIIKGPSREAKVIEKKTRIRTEAATDGMRVTFGKEIDVSKPKIMPVHASPQSLFRKSPHSEE
jgi:phosphoribosyl 1,2-cyclic phosphodiesterase